MPTQNILCILTKAKFCLLYQNHRQMKKKYEKDNPVLWGLMTKVWGHSVFVKLLFCRINVMGHHVWPGLVSNVCQSTILELVSRYFLRSWETVSSNEGCYVCDLWHFLRSLENSIIQWDATCDLWQYMVKVKFRGLELFKKKGHYVKKNSICLFL